MPNDDTRPFGTTEVAASLAHRLKEDEPGAEPAADDGSVHDEHADEPAPFRTPPTVLRRP
jgi:hypothetical protein